MLPTTEEERDSPRTAYEIKLLQEINLLRLKVEHLDQQLAAYKDMDD